MGDMAEDMRFLRETIKQERQDKRDNIVARIILWCAQYSAAAKAVQPWQVRITKDKQVVDIYPISDKYHAIKPENKRGRYKNIEDFLTKHFNIKTG